MIQVVLMDKSRFIDHYKNFNDDKVKELIKYVSDALDENKSSIIEISKWKAEGRL